MFESLEEKVRGKHCDGIAGIIEEGKSIMEEDFDETTMDACLIAAGQRAEHYEMAAYGTLVAWAKAMGHTEAADLCRRPSTRRKRPTRSSQGSPRAGSTKARRTLPILTMKRNRSAPLLAVRERVRRRRVGGSGACRGRHGADSAPVADERRGNR